MNYYIRRWRSVTDSRLMQLKGLRSYEDLTVYGKSKVYEELAKQSGKIVNGHALKITQAENVTDLGQPQIIYLADGKNSALDEILKATEGKPVMIICEREGLYKKGAGFSFTITDINNTELEKRQIKISKNLSTLANSTI